MTPKRNGEPSGFPCPPELCGKGGASRHLDPNEFKMYDTMMAFAKAGKKSRGHDRLVCSAAIRPTLCNAFPCTESNAHKLIERLCKKGWAIKHEIGRDPKTGKQLPNEYEMIEHDEFVKTHPNSCPPNPFAPDFETGEAYGMQRGDRRRNGYLPRNFWTDRTRLEDIDPDYETDAMKVFNEGVAIWWQGTSPEYKAWWMGELEKAREELRDRTVSTNAETVPSPQMRGRTVPTNDESPSPQMNVDRPHKWEGTVSTNVERILESAVLEKADSETTTTTTPPPARPAIADARPWLSLLWSLSINFLEEHDQLDMHRRVRQKLAFRKPKKDEIESPDVAGIENLIELHKEPSVRLAWAEFCIDQHPPVNIEETLYPVSVFLQHFDSYLSAAKRDFNDWHRFKDTSEYFRHQHPAVLLVRSAG